MRKYIKLCVTALLVSIVTLLTSCPATPPSLPSSNDRPYLTPATPQNLRVQSGLQNSFVLEWDKVDSADWYVVEYASADQPSEFTMVSSGIRNNRLTITGRNGIGGMNIDPDESYFFSVKAVASYGTERRESMPSDIVEGAMAPETIQFLVFPTVRDVTLVWHSPNQIGYSGEKLYEADYYLRYKQKNEQNWGDPIPLEDSEDTETISNNMFSTDNPDYDFQIYMEIGDENPVTVESEIITATISEDYTPDAIQSIEIESNRSDYIGVKWSIPSNWRLGDITRDICYFTIERKASSYERKSSSSDWEEIINENEKGQSSSIEYQGDGSEESPLTLEFHDDTAVPGELYQYRINYTVKPIPGDDSIYYESNTDNVQESEKGYLFYPEVSELAASYESLGPAKSNVTLTFKIDAPALSDDLNLRWAVQRNVTHPAEEETKNSIVENSELSDSKFTFTETLNHREEDAVSEHTYTYNLVLLKDDGSIYADFGTFISDETLKLSVPQIINSAITSPDNRVERIELHWSENVYVYEGLDRSTYIYTYQIDGEAPTTISQEKIIYDESGLCSTVIETEKTEPVNISLYVSALDNQYYSTVSTVARVLAFPDDFNLAITSNPDKVILTWDSTNAITENVQYYYEYSYENGKSGMLEIDDITADTLTIEKGSIPDNSEISVKLLAKNTEYENEGSIDPLVIKGVFISAPENIKASKAVSESEVVITWDAVKNADGYNVYRYLNPDLSDAERIGENINETTFTDSNPTLSKPYYTVTALKGTGETEKPFEFESELNTATLESEPVNLGYVFGGAMNAEVETAPVDESGMYRPYTVITWDRVPGATKYTISVLGQSITVDVSGNDHSSDFTKSVNEDGVETLSYHVEGLLDGTYTYYDNTGVLRDSLDVTGYTITATNDSFSTENEQVLGTARRQLKPVEYVNLLNSMLYINLKAAVEEESITDWYPPKDRVLSTHYKEWSNEGFYVKTPTGGGRNTSQSDSPGWISMTGYKHYGTLTFTTRTGNDGIDIRIWTTDNSIWPYYVGNNQLYYIGYMKNDANAESRQGFVDITGEGYLPAVVQLANINVKPVLDDKEDRFKDAYYNVTINNGATVKIDDNESIVRPF